MLAGWLAGWLHVPITSTGTIAVYGTHSAATRWIETKESIHVFISGNNKSGSHLFSQNMRVSRGGGPPGALENLPIFVGNIIWRLEFASPDHLEASAARYISPLEMARS